ncbi:MAG: citrate synthase family protein [Verrucomicrobiales bacterium]|nr:citrate synthase family protein [Verrucomicrobiales bacterium]
MNNQYPTFIPTDEACRILDIKPATLYSYVSRGLIEKEKRGRKKTRYLTADILRLKRKSEARSGHGPVAAEAMNWGQPVIQTSVSCIQDGMLTYRGVSPLEIVKEERSFEFASELLWTGKQPETDPQWSADSISTFLPCEFLPDDVPFPTTVAMLLPYVAARDPDRHLRSQEAELGRARHLIQMIAASVALPESPSLVRESIQQQSVSRILEKALGLPEQKVHRAIDTALILCAEHELNASTFAARIAASTGADLYSGLSSAIGAYSGPKHGQAVVRILALLGEINQHGNASDVAKAHLERGELIPGFGHKLYANGDPRFQPIMEAALSVNPESDDLAHLCNLVEFMDQASDFKPSMDMGLAMLVSAMELSKKKATSLFLIGRLAGWVAHILEQRKRLGILRPRAEYNE